MSYQWYLGESGDVSVPVAGATASTLTVNPSSTQTYWCAVSNPCGATATATATVTVTASCIAPTITTQPQSTYTYAGQTITLSISASGTTLTYTWYRGEPGDRSSYIGTGEQVQVSPQATTTYWCEVQNACGSVVSEAAVVEVRSCNPTFVTQPESTSIPVGGTAVLHAWATTEGTLERTYQWYVNDGNGIQPISGATDYFVYVTPTSDSQYFVRARTNCGHTDSDVVTVTIVATCEAPQITQQPPASVTVAIGQYTTISATATGTDLQYQWYYSPVDVGFFKPLDGATQPSVSVTTNGDYKTYYFLRVYNACGTIDSSSTVVQPSGGGDTSSASFSGTFSIATNGDASIDGTQVRVTKETKLKGHPRSGDRVTIIGKRNDKHIEAWRIEKN